MDRRRFLVIAAAASLVQLSPQRCIAKSDGIASVARAPAQVLVGAKGRCAGARRAYGVAAGPAGFRALRGA
jgi:hypothetical protein